ncbi:hypothetical protein GCM10007977_033010 [Dactylosporangium sucinum]|uniref:Uncharacterized protein n=1 Tax=Dactylosporangium sucinum TaxID=1424081 RepID=A0A917WUI3_9ACTN|nr:hypothetical protein GCM10007977_033010 [Dactylosporangium sucinum]
MAAYGGNPRLEHVTLDADHALSGRRVALIRTVAAFLDRALGTIRR